MIDFFYRGGIGMWLFLLIGIVILVLSVRKAMQLFGGGGADKIQLESGLNAILFWGVICAVLGYFFHYLGLYNAFTAISRAQEISPAVVALGYRESLITILTGLFIFVLSALVWLILRAQLKRRLRETG